MCRDIYYFQMQEDIHANNRELKNVLNAEKLPLCPKWKNSSLSTTWTTWLCEIEMQSSLYVSFTYHSTFFDMKLATLGHI